MGLFGGTVAHSNSRPSGHAQSLSLVLRPRDDGYLERITLLHVIVTSRSCPHFDVLNLLVSLSSYCLFFNIILAAFA